jgi:hypothetical protein
VDSAFGVSIDARARGFENVIGGSGSDYIVSTVAAYNYNDPDDGRAAFSGGAGNDTLIGGEANDLLVGDAGADVLTAAGGNDIVIVDGQDNLANVTGGWGYDTLMVNGPSGVYVSNLQNMGFEVAHGGDGNDTIYASRSDEHAGDALTVATRYGLSLRKISLRVLIGRILMRRGDPQSGRALIISGRAAASRVGYQQVVSNAQKALMEMDWR